MSIADQRPSQSVCLASPGGLLERVRSGRPLTGRGRELIEAIRRVIPTDPRAGGPDRLRFMLGGLQREIHQLAIRRQLQAPGTTTPGQNRFDVSDQYFLIKRDNGTDPVDLLLESLLVSTADLLEDLLARGTALGDVELYYLVYPLTAASALLEDVGDAVSPTGS